MIEVFATILVVIAVILVVVAVILVVVASIGVVVAVFAKNKQFNIGIIDGTQAALVINNFSCNKVTF